MVEARVVARLALVCVGAFGAAVAGYALFVLVPATLADFLGVLATLALVVLVVKVASGLAGAAFPDYDVAEVTVEGPITRDGGGGRVPAAPRGATADDVVAEIDRADEDGNVDALLVKLNTPGGEIVPSEDIRLAVERFDGPTTAYATDVCASGGYWIASGCDELWAREATLVGSIGVIGSRITASEFADKLGLSYEGFTAGEYKDAGTPLKDLEDDERAYLQGLVDDFYDRFVERVSEGRDLEPSVVRETEARVYLGEAAADLGLVDDVGTKRDVEDRLADRLGRESVTVEAFEPTRPLVERVGAGVSGAAYALGAGLAAFANDRGFRLRT